MPQENLLPHFLGLVLKLVLNKHDPIFTFKFFQHSFLPDIGFDENIPIYSLLIKGF